MGYFFILQYTNLYRNEKSLQLKNIVCKYICTIVPHGTYIPMGGDHREPHSLPPTIPPPIFGKQFSI